MFHSLLLNIRKMWIVKKLLKDKNYSHLNTLLDDEIELWQTSHRHNIHDLKQHTKKHWKIRTATEVSSTRFILMVHPNNRTQVGKAKTQVIVASWPYHICQCHSQVSISNFTILASNCVFYLSNLPESWVDSHYVQ